MFGWVVTFHRFVVRLTRVEGVRGSAGVGVAGCGSHNLDVRNCSSAPVSAFSWPLEDVWCVLAGGWWMVPH